MSRRPLARWPLLVASQLKTTIRKQVAGFPEIVADPSLADRAEIVLPRERPTTVTRMALFV